MPVTKVYLDWGAGIRDMRVSSEILVGVLLGNILEKIIFVHGPNVLSSLIQPHEVMDINPK